MDNKETIGEFCKNKSAKNGFNYKCKIYFLFSSEDSTEIRYIGKTIQPLKYRLTNHIKQSMKCKTKNYKCNWIKNVLSNGFKVEIMLIGEVRGDGCKEEVSYIEYGRKEGWKLTNLTEGGEGSSGYKHTPESRLKISQAKLGMPSPFKNKTCSKEQIEKNRLSHLGQSPWNKEKHGIYSKETLLKMGETNRGKHLSENIRKKISLRLKGRVVSEATRQKLSLIHKGKLASEKAKARMRLAQKGHKATNKGMHHTLETKQKMKDRYKNMSIEKKQQRSLKISMAKRGIPLSLEHRQKIKDGFLRKNKII